MERPGPEKAKPEVPVAERLAQAEPYFEHVIDELAPDIRAGRWTDILGDDVSGRVPALVIHDVIGRYQSEHDLPPVSLSFAALGKPGQDVVRSLKEAGMGPVAVSDGFSQAYQDKAQTIQDMLARRYSDKPEARLLLVTEMTNIGGTVRDTSRMMTELGIAHDVVSQTDRASDLDQTLGFKPGIRTYGGFDLEGYQSSEFSPLPFEYMKAVPESPNYRAAIGVEKQGLDAQTTASRTNQAGVEQLRGQIEALSDKLYARL